ncbi:MAG TPA: hypothetical protein VGX95_09375 [Xanthobacteraceae bacterium]|jgi:hypothetical protein|nr:hypothetical protein [Xanthobacteraceae bacterium]
MARTAHGALIELIPGLIPSMPVPNMITFQFNPENVTHTWAQQTEEAVAGKKQNPLAVKGDPKESFSFKLEMDSDDTQAHANAVAAGFASASGLYPRLSALERLLYPVPTKKELAARKLVGTVTALMNAALGAPFGTVFGAALKTKLVADVPTFQVPTVLFVWGLYCILPVRVTEFKVTKSHFDLFLNPVHAEADITLDVLTEDDLKASDVAGAELATGAYAFTDLYRKLFAAENVANIVDDGSPMVPL